MSDYSVTFSAPCPNGHPATWRTTSNNETAVHCETCDANAPARRWADSDGRTVL